MKQMLALGLALGSLATFSNGAQAVTQCGPRDKIIEVLERRFQEKRQGLGLAGQSAIIELFVSIRGSWTVTTTNPQGLTCVIATGEAWENEAKQIAGLSS
jgi:hypothetical protein